MNRIELPVPLHADPARLRFWQRTAVFCVALLATVASPGQGFEMEWVTIADPGNPPDPIIWGLHGESGIRCCEESRGTADYGAVGYVFRMGKFEVTIAQWVEFLNAVAASDTHGLYSEGIGGQFMARFIERVGSEGSYSYASLPRNENLPIPFADFFDVLRFANWMQNGQPTGAQDITTTEDGAYTLLGANPINVTRNPGAQVFLPDEDEWHKAAYYDPVTRSYFLYPMGSDTTPTATPPPGGPNSANFADPANLPPPDGRSACGYEPETNLGPCEPTDVGSYFLSPSPYGTFDQGGNLFEWTEGLFEEGDRGFRGGQALRGSFDLASWFLDNSPPLCQNCGTLGFRVAAVPEVGGELALCAAGVSVLLLARRARPRLEGAPGSGSRAAS